MLSSFDKTTQSFIKGVVLAALAKKGTDVIFLPNAMIKGKLYHLNGRHFFACD